MWLRESVMDNGQEALCDAEAPVWLQKSRLAHTGWEAFPHTGTRGRGGGLVQHKGAGWEEVPRRLDTCGSHKGEGALGSPRGVTGFCVTGTGLSPAVGVSWVGCGDADR